MATTVAIDPSTIETRLVALERSHECPDDPKRAKWCEAEPCRTLWTIQTMRALLLEIERLNGDTRSLTIALSLAESVKADALRAASMAEATIADLRMALAEATGEEAE